MGVCTELLGFATHLGITRGQHFQLLHPEACIHWVFGLFESWFILDLKAQPFSSAQIDFLSLLASSKLFSCQLLLLWDSYITLQHLLGSYLPLSTFSPFDQRMRRVVNSTGNKAPFSSRTVGMNQVELCQTWEALMNFSFHYLPYFLLLWLPFL